MKVFVITLAVLAVGVYGHQRCYPIASAPTAPPEDGDTPVLGNSKTVPPTRAPDCIDELLAKVGTQMPKFSTILKDNAEILRTQPNGCETQANFVSIFELPPLNASSYAGEIQTIQSVDQCIQYYQYAQQFAYDAAYQGELYGDMWIRFRIVVEEIKQELADTADPNHQQVAQIYDDLFDAAVEDLGAYIQNYFITSCEEAKVDFPDYIDVGLCVGCVNYAVDNLQEVLPYIDPNSGDATTRTPDCIDELLAQVPFMPKFSTILRDNADTLRTQPDGCNVQATLVALFALPNTAAPTYTGEIQTVQTVDQCVEYYQYAQQFVIDATNEGELYADLLKRYQVVVDEVKKELADTADPNSQQVAQIYDDLFDAAVEDLGSYVQNYFIRSCEEASVDFPGNIDIGLCVGCVNYAVDNLQEVMPLLDQAGAP